MHYSEGRISIATCIEVVNLLHVARRDYFAAAAATHESRLQATTPAVQFSKENSGRIKEGDVLMAQGAYI